jgi:hypothetical protein
LQVVLGAIKAVVRTMSPASQEGQRNQKCQQVWTAEPRALKAALRSWTAVLGAVKAVLGAFRGGEAVFNPPPSKSVLRALTVVLGFLKAVRKAVKAVLRAV